MRKPVFITLSICLVSACAVFIQMRAAARSPQSKLEKLPEEKVVAEDTIEFANNDILTGDIVSITGDTIEFDGKMISGRCAISLGNVKRILFPREIDIKVESESDQIIFPNGDRLSVDINNMDKKILQAETLTGDAIKLDRQKLEGLVFKKVSMKLMEEHFEDPGNVKFNVVSGEWIVEDGMYVQKKTASSTYSASAPLTQQGRYRYRWSVDASKGGQTGFYFFAQNGSTIRGGNSYYVMLSGRSVYLYKCINDNQQYYASYTVPSGENLVKFDLEFDSGKGTIILTINGQQAMRWKDTKPIEKGRYMILQSSGNAAFDDVIVSRTGDSFLPSLDSESADEDVILFVNGDLLSGTVVNVTEGDVVVENEYDPEGMVIAKSKISSLRFKAENRGELLQSGDSYKFIMWNDDTITGEILKLDDGYLKLESNVIGELLIPRKLLKRIEAPQKLKL